MRYFLFFLLLGSVPAWATLPVPVGVGEEFTYRVGWGIFTHAGEIKITARAETNDHEPCTVVVATTSTRGFLRGLYAFDARAESVFENRTGRMLVHTERSTANQKPSDTTLAFNYRTGVADYRNDIQPEKNQAVTLPPGDPMDLITCLVQTRTWNLKPGQTRDVLVMFEEEPYELTFHALGYEEVDTPLGKFNTLVLEPRMERTAPKGMFKRGSNVRVWISQDEKHLPVRFEVEFKFGVGVSTLTKYSPPSDQASAPHESPDS